MALFRASAANLMRKHRKNSTSPEATKKTLAVKRANENLGAFNESSSSNESNMRGPTTTTFKDTMMRRSKGSDFSTEDNTPLNLRIQITERREDGEIGEIFYKDDKDRFSQQYTVKLKTFSEYSVTVEVNPPRELISFKVGDRNYKNFNKSEHGVDVGGGFDESFTFIWSTAMFRTTERKHRSVLPISIKFHRRREVNFDMFVKFYYSCEMVHYNGSLLTCIQLNTGDETLGGNDKTRNIVNLK